MIEHLISELSLDPAAKDRRALIFERIMHNLHMVFRGYCDRHNEPSACNRLCVRPSHLELVTNLQNQRRKHARIKENKNETEQV